jgi:hypothetical protein
MEKAGQVWELEERPQAASPQTSESGIPRIPTPFTMIADFISPPTQTPAAQTTVAPQDKQGAQTWELEKGPGKMPVSDVLINAAKNAPGSLYGVAESMVQPILHPIDTAQAIGSVGKGLLSKAKGTFASQDPTKKAENEAVVNAIGEQFSKRYGGWENIKRTFAEDPAGVLADISTPFTLGGSLAARAPGVIGKAGAAARTAGEAIDPISLALKGTAKTVEKAGDVFAYPMALRSGASVNSLQDAAKAGATGNPKFWEFYQGTGTASDYVNALEKAALDAATARNNAYQTSKAGLAYNTKPLSFTNIDKTIADQFNSIRSLGKTVRPNAEKALNDVVTVVNEWKSQPKTAGANAVVDMDALKQRIGDIRDAYSGDANASRVVSNAYTSVYDTLKKAAPEYAPMMEAYRNSTKELAEVKKGLGIGKNAPVTQVIRKVLKEQNSKAGNQLFESLAKQNPDLPYMLAGLELSEKLPYGNIRRALSGADLLGGASGVGMATATMMGLPIAPIAYGVNLATAPLASPKVSGGLQYGVGKAGAAANAPADIYNRIPSMIPASAYAAGRVYEEAGDADEARMRPVTIRPERAAGGKVSSTSIADRLITAAESAKRMSNKATEPLLRTSDESIARALEIANRHI